MVQRKEEKKTKIQRARKRSRVGVEIVPESPQTLVVNEFEFDSPDTVSRKEEAFQPSQLSEVCTRLTDAKSLFAVYLSLTRVPAGMCDLNNLRTLSLKCNELTELPETLEQLESLKVLDLSFNQFTTMPQVIFKLTQLVNVDLSGNPITELGEIPVSASRIKILNLDVTRLVHLPESLSRLTKLEHLSVVMAMLEDLPVSLHQLQSLRVLRVHCNSIEELPETFGMCPQLRIFRCDMNRLSRLPESICQLRQLEKLILTSNLLTELPKSIGYLPSIKHVRLSENRLEYLPASTAAWRKGVEVHTRHNPFVQPVPRRKPGPKTLMELGLQNVAMLGIPLTEKDLPRTVLEHFPDMKGCESIGCKGRYTEDMKITGISNVAFSLPRRTLVPISGSFCSQSCNYEMPAYPI